MLTEYAPCGSLLNLVAMNGRTGENGRMSELDASLYLSQVAAAVSYLHSEDWRTRLQERGWLDFRKLGGFTASMCFPSMPIQRVIAHVHVSCTAQRVNCASYLSSLKRGDPGTEMPTNAATAT
eukprot:5203140-Amphidinium_carterae.1